MLSVLVIVLSIKILTAQFSSCEWEEFSLIPAQGYEIHCAESSFAIGMILSEIHTSRCKCDT